MHTTNFSSYRVCRLEGDSNLALHHLYDRWMAAHLVMGRISDRITFMQIDDNNTGSSIKFRCPTS